MVSEPLARRSLTVAAFLLLVASVLVMGCSGGEPSAIVTVGGTIDTDSTRPSSTTTTEPRTTTTVASTTTTETPTTTTTMVREGISWEWALDHVGEKVTILGPVVDTAYAPSSNGSPTFLNIGRPYPDPGRFQVVIWGEDRDRFPSPPEDMYYGQKIAVTGTVKNYKGVGEIIVRSPDQIEVY